MKNNINIAKIFFMFFSATILNYAIDSILFAILKPSVNNIINILQVINATIYFILIISIYAFYKHKLERPVDKTLMQVWLSWFIIYIIAVAVLRIYKMMSASRYPIDENFIFIMASMKQIILMFSLVYANVFSAIITGLKRFYVISSIIFIIGIIVVIMFIQNHMIRNIYTPLIGLNFLCNGIALIKHQNKLSSTN